MPPANGTGLGNYVMPKKLILGLKCKTRLAKNSFEIQAGTTFRKWLKFWAKKE